MLIPSIILSKPVIQDIHHILGILSVNSFVVHDGGSDETSSDLIGTSLCGTHYIIWNKMIKITYNFKICIVWRNFD